MNRECFCDRIKIGKEFVNNEHCRKCWLWHHSKRWRAMWGGNPDDVEDDLHERTRKTVDSVNKAEEIEKAKKKAQSARCIYLGEALPAHMQLNSEGKPCKTCGEKLRKCDVHTICTTKVKRKGVACCDGCDDKVVDVEE